MKIRSRLVSMLAAAGGTDLQVSGSASTGPPNATAPFAYTFQVKNSGPDTATSVVFTIPLPTGTVPNYATADGSTLPCAAYGDNAGGTYFRCSLGTIAKGGQSTVVANVNAPAIPSTFSAVGTVSSITPDPQSTNNSATVTVQVKASTGGVCKGGVCDPPPTTTAAPCAALGNVSAPVGYYASWAAIWNTMTVLSCSTAAGNVLALASVGAVTPAPR
jgi:uncharacterized repeat protein (TIGR01451 family)